MSITPKIDVGNLITIVVLLIGGAISWGNVSDKLDEH